MIILLFILLAIISIGLFLWQFSNLISVFYGSPYVMMDKKVIREALKLSGLKKGEVFYDLGCGNGDVLISAAKMGAKAEGYEISPYFYIWAKIRIGLLKSIHSKCWSTLSGIRLRDIKIHYEDIFNADLSKADVVYCYLLPKMLERLAFKFDKEMKNESRLISIGFPVLKIKAGAVIINECTISNRKIFIYKF